MSEVPAANYDQQEHPNTCRPTQYSAIHWPSELSEILSTQFRKDIWDLSPEEEEALSKYQNERNLYDCAPGDDPEDPALIERHFDFFDRFYFFGLLSKRVQDRIFTFEPATKMIYGLTLVGYSPEGNIEHRSIQLFQIVHKGLEDPQKRLNWYLGVLLHEMLHAFLRIFSINKRIFKDTARRHENELGCTGHGVAWQDAAFALEKATQKWGHKADLRRQKNLVIEIQDGMEKAGLLDMYSLGRVWEWGIDLENVLHFKKEKVSFWEIPEDAMLMDCYTRGRATGATWFKALMNHYPMYDYASKNKDVQSNIIRHAISLYPPLIDLMVESS